jgi:amidase
MSQCTLGNPVFAGDPNFLDVPWRESRFSACLNSRPTIAILNDDGHIHPQPPISRALAIVRKSLQDQGLEVVSWVPPPHAPAVENLFRMIGADGASESVLR